MLFNVFLQNINDQMLQLYAHYLFFINNKWVPSFKKVYIHCFVHTWKPNSKYRNTINFFIRSKTLNQYLFSSLFFLLKKYPHLYNEIFKIQELLLVHKQIKHTVSPLFTQKTYQNTLIPYLEEKLNNNKTCHI
jgi:hypothetical protein